MENNFVNQKALELAVKEIEKRFGKETFSQNESFSKLDVIKTGSLLLDNAIGVGGFPKGRIVEIYGNESSGKTTIALQAVKECIKANGNVAYIDAENSLDAKYLKSLDIDPNKVLIANPEYGEQAFAIIDALVKTNMVDLIIVDSVAALVPKSDMEASMEDQSMGTHARLMSRGLKVIQSSIAKSNTCVVFINQVREKIGVMFGNNEITTGGRALKFFSSLRLDVRRSELLKSGNDVIGIKSKVTITKNKVAIPFKTCFVDIFFNKGFNPIKEIVDFAIEYEIVQKSGSWYYFEDKKLSQGRNNLDSYLNENQDLYTKIKDLVLKKIES
ncbi:MAG: recombinase RecA [Malacoplasma sp.]|nr:recombinase RecA [Malacoplasma sp.]MDE5774925.1 recombinase RecA [Malacoplasma sp.]